MKTEAIEDLEQVRFGQQPRWRRWLRRNLRIIVNAVGAAGMSAATAGHARYKAPFEVDYDDVPMPLPNLPSSFNGYRITQVTDLHTDGTMLPHLREVVKRVNGINPDLIVITGDVVSHSHDWIDAAVEIVASFKAPVLITFGNHDYTTVPEPYLASDVVDELAAKLRKHPHLHVLRNEAHSVQHPDGRIWLVGLEEVWSNNFKPSIAFANVPKDEPKIALSHNPDTGPTLSKYADWILTGHTHGGQIRLPFIGGLMLPMEHKEFDQGLFKIGNATMFVSRGVGCRVPVRFRCPPQVTTFTLKPM